MCRCRRKILEGTHAENSIAGSASTAVRALVVYRNVDCRLGESEYWGIHHRPSRFVSFLSTSLGLGTLKETRRAQEEDGAWMQLGAPIYIFTSSLAQRNRRSDLSSWQMTGSLNNSSCGVSCYFRLLVTILVRCPVLSMACSLPLCVLLLFLAT